MNLNKKAISRLLAMSDEELSAVIRTVAAEAGADVSKISLTSADMAKLRAALSVASADEIAQLARQFGISKK